MGFCKAVLPYVLWKRLNREALAGGSLELKCTAINKVLRSACVRMPGCECVCVFTIMFEG